MKNVTVADPSDKLGLAVDLAQKELVVIHSEGRPIAVLMSVEAYEAERGGLGVKVKSHTNLPNLEKELVRYRDLDHLAGTWSDEDLKEFEAGTADFGNVDDSLWH